MTFYELNNKRKKELIDAIIGDEKCMQRVCIKLITQQKKKQFYIKVHDN